MAAAIVSASMSCQNDRMLGVVLVRFTSEDQPGFASLVKDVLQEYGFSYHPRLDADLTDPGSHYAHLWVLRSGGGVVGSVALCSPVGRSVTLKRMYLRPEFRGMGWGRLLLNTALEAARSDGCNEVLLDTSERQAGAIRLYEAAGFELQRRSGGSLFYSKSMIPH